MSAIRPAPRDTSFETPQLAETTFGDYASTLTYDSLYHSPVGTAWLGGNIKGGVSRLTESFLEKHWGSGDKISSEQANETYGLDGEISFSEPVYESYAQLIHDRKIGELRRNYELQSGSYNHWGRKISGFGVSMATTVLDPVNLASMFIPVVGEANYLKGFQRSASFFERGLISPKTLARFAGTNPAKFRAAKGAIEGLVGAALVEPFNLIPALEEQADYGWQDSAMNLVFSSTLGGTFHVAGGYIGDKMASLRKMLGKTIDPQTHEAATLSAVTELAQDQPIASPAQLVSVDHNAVALELQQVNTENLFNIAREHVSRLEQLKDQGALNPTQEMRLKLISAMLRNPTDATPENLASLFELKLNDEVGKMPDAYRFTEGERTKPSTSSPVTYDKAKYNELVKKVEEVGNQALDEGGSDDFLPHEWMKNEPESFREAIKILLKAGYNVFDSEIRSGTESIAFIMKDRVAKVTFSEQDFHFPGVTLVPEFTGKSGDFHIEVVDKVAPLIDLNLPENVFTQAGTDTVYSEALKLLGMKYGFSSGDFNPYNLGFTRDGKLVLLDRGFVAKDDKFKSNFEKEFKSSPEQVQLLYSQLVKQVEEAKMQEQNTIESRVKSIVEKRKQQLQSKPIESSPTVEPKGVDPVKLQPDTIERLTPEEEKSAIADLESEISDMEQELEIEEPTGDLKLIDENLKKANKLSKALEAGANCITKKIV